MEGQREALQLSDTQEIPTKILLVDDHEVVRIGLKALLSKVKGFKIVGEAASAEEAKTLLEEATPESMPDVILLDVRLPGESGIDACQNILARYRELKIIMLTSYSDEDAVFRAIVAGAAGYVLKQTNSDDLVAAIRTVQKGGAVLDPQTTKQVMKAIRIGRFTAKNVLSNGFSRNGKLHAAPDGAADAATEALNELPEPLSDQEQRILALIAEGKTNKSIAEDIYLSEKTVRNYVSNILGKLQLSNRAEAAAFAVRNGLAAGE